MKSVSRVTLALVAALGMGAVTAIPAAQAAKAKKETAPKGPTPELSAPFRKAFVEVQTAVKAANPVDLQTKIAALEPLASTADEKYYLGVMRFELAKLTKEKALTRRAINEMAASGSKLIANLPELNYNAGALAYDAGDYRDTLAKMALADQQGSKDINRLLLMAESNFKLNQVPTGLAVLERAVTEQKAAGQAPPQDWFRRALSVALKGKMAGDVAKWSQELVRYHPSTTNWRDALVIYRDGSRLDPLVQLDIFRLMRETKSLAGEKDFYDYAAVANERALPGEAKAIIEEGYASGAAAKSSRPIAEMLTLASSKLAADQAGLAADEKRARSAGDGKIAANTGNAFLGYGNYSKAIDLLKLALSKGGADNDAINTRLGIALTKSGQKAEARQAFAAVKGVRADIARYWTLYLDLNP